MQTPALYHWNVSGSPVNVLIELPVVERLRAAASASEQEIGGLLIGSFDGNYTVVSDFEAIESEHRRGLGYQLSSRDERKMAARIEWWSRRKQGQVVGAFRSHRRSGMYLDEFDNGLLSSYFHNQQQVALLIKPETDGTATGGFFFWEDGEVNRKQTYLPFPMNARELEDGDFPLVEPVVSESVTSAQESPAAPTSEPAPDWKDDWKPAQALHPETAAPLAFEFADTLDHAPAPAEPAPPIAKPAGTRRSVLPTPPPPAREPRVGSRTLGWPFAILMVAVAAIGGYVFGTSNSRGDRFGARAGDVVVNSEPPAPEPVKPVEKPQAATAQATNKSPEIAPPVPAPIAKPTKPVATPKPVPAAAPPRKPVASAVLASKPSPAPSIPTNSAPDPQPSPDTANAAPVAANESPTRPPGFAWSRYASPAPEPAPKTEPAADSAVSVEPAEAGAFKRAARHIPLFGSMSGAHEGSADFTPAQVIHSFAPKVPADLARSLAGPTPVDLKLKLDKTGKVRSVELISKQVSPELTQLAGDAAYRWQFEPAHLKDKTVASEVIAHFRFRPAL